MNKENNETLGVIFREKNFLEHTKGNSNIK